MTSSVLNLRTLACCLAPLLALVPLALAGCPDTEGEYKDFTKRTKDKRAGGDDGGNMGMYCPECDLSGTHLVAIDTVVLPGTPLQFIADFDVDLDAMVMDATFTPLSLELASTTVPREELPANPIIVNGIPINEDGSVEIDFGEVMVEGDANPITGSDIVTTVVINVGALDDDTFCGSADGMVTSPIQQGLEGSTVAGIRLTDRGDRPDDFPCVGEGGDKLCFTSCDTIVDYMAE